MAILGVLQKASGTLLVDAVPSTKGPRITYRESPTLGVIDTLSSRKWLRPLIDDPACAASVARILIRLAQIEIQHPGDPRLVAASLHARRQIALAAYGLDPGDFESAAMFLSREGGRLPSVCCLPPNENKALVQTGNAARLRFVQDVETFWGPTPLSPQARRATADEEETPTSNYFKLTSARILHCSPVADEEALAIDSPRTIRRFADLSLAGDLLACNTRQLEIGGAVLQRSAAYANRAWKVFGPKEWTAWLIALISLRFGIPVTDLFCLPLTATPVSSAPGALDLSRARLSLFPGNGFNEGLFGRIPFGQRIEVQLTGTLALLCELLEKNAGGMPTLQAILGDSSRDVYTNSIKAALSPHHNVGSSFAPFVPAWKRNIEAQLCRLHACWLYSGLVLAGSSPAVMSLICSRTISPFRADCNYIRISRATLQNTLVDINEAQNHLAGLGSHDVPVVLQPDWVGVDAPPLAEVVKRIHGADNQAIPSVGSAGLEALPALLGARPGGICQRVFDGQRSFLALADKNLGVGMRTRIVPIPFDIPAGVGGQQRDPERYDSSLGFTPENAPRKSVLSALTEANASQIVSGLVSEHIDNSLLPGGPLCPLPTSLIVNHATEWLGKVYQDACSGENLHELLFAAGAQEPTESVLTAAVGSKVRHRHTSGVYLPDNEDFEIVGKATAYISENLRHLGRPRWFASLIIVLSGLVGIPWENLRRYAAYYSLSDFVTLGGQLFFVALLPQKGGGLGAIPLPIGKADSVAGQLVQRAFGNHRTRRRRFFKDGRDSLQDLLRPLNIDEASFIRAVSRVAYYRCHCRFSGFVAAGLLGRLIIPCNYIAESDIFASLELGTPVGLDGAPWTSPHKATSRTPDYTAPCNDTIRPLLGGSNRLPLGERGMGRLLPESLHTCPSGWKIAEWTEFAQQFHPVPNQSILQHWIEISASHHGNCDAKVVKKLLQGTVRNLQNLGKWPLDPAVRLVPRSTIKKFLSVFLEELASEHKDPKGEGLGKRGKRLIAGGLIAIVFGARPKENLALRLRHLRVRGNLLCACIKGVKKTNRARRDAIANLIRGNDILEWATGELRKHLITLKADKEITLSSRISDFDSASCRQFREALQDALRAAARRVLGDDEGITCYTLRHLCATLLLEAALVNAGTLNFFTLLGTIAANMGHSLPEFLGGYIGTGIIAILRTAKLLPCSRDVDGAPSK